MEEFDQKAKVFIKKMMLERNINAIELTKKLNENGYKCTENSVRLKISRGRFDFSFLLLVANVLNYKIEYIEE